VGALVAGEQEDVSGRRLKALAFVGWSGSGKTTLIEKLLPRLRRGGLRAGYLKTDAHGFEMDREGKDTARAFDAGAPVVAIVGPGEAAIRLRGDVRPEALLEGSFAGCDLVLVEGGKRSALPKVVVRGKEPLDAERVVAEVGEGRGEGEVPRFARDDVEGLALFLEAWLRG